MDLTVASTAEPWVALVILDGELDLLTCGEVSGRLTALTDAGCRNLQVDMSRVTFADASSIGVLASARNALKPLGGVLQVVDSSPAVARLLRLTEMQATFA